MQGAVAAVGIECNCSIRMVLALCGDRNSAKRETDGRLSEFEGGRLEEEEEEEAGVKRGVLLCVSDCTKLEAYLYIYIYVCICRIAVYRQYSQV